MQILLCRGRGLISGAIKLQTRSQYSHAALLFSDGKLLEATWPRVRQLDAIPADYNYDAYEIPGLTVEQEAKIRAFAEKQLGKPYDLTMVIRFVTRAQETRKSKGAWFCSEYAFAAVREGGITLLINIDPWAVSPGLLGLSPILKRRTGTFTEYETAKDTEETAGRKAHEWEEITGTVSAT